MIKNLKWSSNDDHEAFLDDMKKLERKWRKEEVQGNWEYFLYRILVKAGSENIDVYMREQLEEEGQSKAYSQ